MTSILFGLVLSIIIILFARVTRFDRDTSFYPTLLIIIASYYVLFAAIAGHSVKLELAVALVFLIVAILGAYKSLAVVGFGIFAHGIYDTLHVMYISNSVSPTWWPIFCATVDIVLGLWVIYLSQHRQCNNVSGN